MTEQTDTTNQASPHTYVAPGPHLQDQSFTTRRMMTDVLIGLSPVVLVSLIVFRQYAAIQLAACIGGCCVAEWLFQAMRRKPFSLWDCSATVTGVILAMSLPWNCPIWVSVIASFIAMGIGKVIFGGVGSNIFNPAMVGRAFVMLAFTWSLGAAAYTGDLNKNNQADYLDKMPWLESLHATPQQYAEGEIDAKSGATPMAAKKAYHNSGGQDGFDTKLLPLVLGNNIGSLGEVSALACLLGGIFLVIRRTASWEIPLGMLLGVAVLAALMYGVNPAKGWSVWHEISGGALLFGAFFIATDPVTSPLTPKGKFIFGLGNGLLIVLIREFSGYPEGVMFAVLLMNGMAPLINRWTIPTPFGGKPKPAPAKA